MSPGSSLQPYGEISFSNFQVSPRSLYRASGASAAYQISQIYGGGLIPILAGLLLNAYGIHTAYIYIGLLVMVYAALAILATLRTPDTTQIDLETMAPRA